MSSEDEEMVQIEDVGDDDSEKSAAAPSQRSEMQIDTKTKTEQDEDFSQADLNRLVEESSQARPDDDNYDDNEDEGE